MAFFATSVPFLYLLMKRVSTGHSGFFAVGVYTLTPLSVLTSRSFMPDMASLSCSIAALALFAEWLTRAPHAPLFLAMSMATSLAILIKAPAIIIGLPLGYMAWTAYGAQLFRRRALWGLRPGACSCGGVVRARLWDKPCLSSVSFLWGKRHCDYGLGLV